VNTYLLGLRSIPRGHQSPITLTAARLPSLALEPALGHGETPKLGDERAERTCIRELDIQGMASTKEGRGEGERDP
jgi:hypothetical protein